MSIAQTQLEQPFSKNNIVDLASIYDKCLSFNGRTDCGLEYGLQTIENEVRGVYKTLLKYTRTEIIREEDLRLLIEAYAKILIRTFSTVYASPEFTAKRKESGKIFQLFCWQLNAYILQELLIYKTRDLFSANNELEFVFTRPNTRGFELLFKKTRKPQTFLRIELEGSVGMHYINQHLDFDTILIHDSDCFQCEDVSELRVRMLQMNSNQSNVDGKCRYFNTTRIDELIQPVKLTDSNYLSFIVNQITNFNQDQWSTLIYSDTSIKDTLNQSNGDTRA